MQQKVNGGSLPHGENGRNKGKSANPATSDTDLSIP
jgi:hypothetical protein